MWKAIATLLLVAAPAAADEPPHAADDGVAGIRTWRIGEPTQEPLLHLDAVAPLAALAEGGILDGQRAVLDLGQLRLAGEGAWWQSGLAPSMFATDLQNNGWRAAAELSYDLGPVRIGVNASLTRAGDTSHRMVGLFAYRTFRLSHWMRAWIVLGVAFEEWTGDPRGPRRGGVAGLAIGTTFR